jgi:hypothetical protein
MADETPVVTPGKETSEWKFTAVAMVFGAILDGVGIALETLRDSGVIHGTWLPVALVIVGTLLMLVSKLGYVRSRALVKMAALQGQGVTAIQASAPLVEAVVKALREQEAKKAPVPSAELATETPTRP